MHNFKKYYKANRTNMEGVMEKIELEFHFEITMSDYSDCGNIRVVCDTEDNRLDELINVFYEDYSWLFFTESINERLEEIEEDIKEAIYCYCN